MMKKNPSDFFYELDIVSTIFIEQIRNYDISWIFIQNAPRYSKCPLVCYKIFPAEGREIFWSLKSPETSKNEVFGAAGADFFWECPNYSKYPPC